MTFLDNIFARLATASDAVFLRELRDGQTPPGTGSELLERITKARVFLSGQRLKKGDRVALLGHNSIDWVAIDLAIMAEGLIVVPLYARQAPAELVAMMKDCAPALICCGDGALRDGIVREWPDAPPQHLFADILATKPGGVTAQRIAESDPVTIIYTSGTSGEAKGVVLTAGNIGHMLGCTSERLDTLMETRPGQDRVFHYLPFCFAGSWIMLLTCLLRGSQLTLNTDLTKLAGDDAHRRSRLLSECSRTCSSACARQLTNSYGRRGASFKHLQQGQSRVDAQAGTERELRGLHVADMRKVCGVPHHPQEDDRSES